MASATSCGFGASLPSNLDMKLLNMASGIWPTSPYDFVTSVPAGVCMLAEKLGGEPPGRTSTTSTPRCAALYPELSGSASSAKLLAPKMAGDGDDPRARAAP